MGNNKQTTICNQCENKCQNCRQKLCVSCVLSCASCADEFHLCSDCVPQSFVLKKKNKKKTHFKPLIFFLYFFIFMSVFSYLFFVFSLFYVLNNLFFPFVLFVLFVFFSVCVCECATCQQNTSQHKKKANKRNHTHRHRHRHRHTKTKKCETVFVDRIDYETGIEIKKDKEYSYCERCEGWICKTCCFISEKHMYHQRISFLMGTHHRVGKQSAIFKFYKKADIELFKMIFQFVGSKGAYFELFGIDDSF